MSVVEWGLVSLSLFFIIVGTIAGTFMKNYYVRLHFMSIADTIGGATLFTTFGIFSQHHFAYFLLAFVLIAQGPAITHLLARGAVHSRINVEEKRWRSHKR